jgi:nucleoside phosphorylase/CheY-like chemotaxis protein
MNILVVDDHPRRYQKLIETLSGLDISRDQISVVTCANDARDLLEHKQFDLMIIDIILPLRAEEEPHSRHSIELLNEIIEYGELKRPRQIVGLSSSDVAAVSVTPFFSDRLWTVIRYNESSDEWSEQIKNCVRYMLNIEPEVVPQWTFDLIVLCALAEPELGAILELPWNWRPPRPIDDVTFIHEGTIKLGESIFSVAATSVPRMGMVHTALLASKLIENFRPKLLVMTGICAGVIGKTSIGDALLADPTWDWQSGKRTKNLGASTFAISPHQLGIDSMIRSRFEQLKSEKAALAQIGGAWKGGSLIPKIVIGPVASGSVVLADGSIAEKIREQHRDLCGIEMEAYGMYSAVAMATRPRPLAFSIKAVCDFADQTKNDDNQSYAAFVSARVLALFLDRYGDHLFQASV